jgi:hypothetical protein
MARNQSKWDITNNIHAPAAEINTPRMRRSGSQPTEKALARREPSATVSQPR